jgi:DNA-binding response OmpR family regulator
MDKKNVLIIDDNVMMQHILTFILEDEGFTVDSCADGVTALNLTKEQAFKVYLVDYRLPEMMGDAVTVDLRKRYPDAYIIGYSIEHREQDFLKAGADKFIIKENLIRELIPSIKDTDRLNPSSCNPQAPAGSNAL